MADSTPSKMTRTESPVALADLDLQALREYRNSLSEEERRVSYWRRSVQARLDVLTAASGADAPLSMDDLARALGTTGTGARRQQLLSVAADEGLPDLPGFGDLWAAVIDPQDQEAVGAACASLSDAEQQLTAYRKSLHKRIDDATAELIVRYQEDPDLSLDLLPEDKASASA